MPTCSIDQSEAVRRYYAAFPALKKGQESPLPYYLPPPIWCNKTEPDKMQSELSLIKDYNDKLYRNKRVASVKERRNSYHGQRRSNRKRHNSYGRSFESKESLPEWVTHEGVWDIETQDPVKEFIRAIALDEGYGTCENTVTDEVKDMASMQADEVPDWDDGLDLATAWVLPEEETQRVQPDDELYAKFEAKFDRSLEALWAKQGTPDDEYQDLPIDFQDLLSSPSDRMFEGPGVWGLSPVAWGPASPGAWGPVTASPVAWGPVTASPNAWAPAAASPNAWGAVTSPALHDRLRPLSLQPPELEVALCEGDVHDALASVARTLRSLTALNHSRERSGFAEVPPRRAPVTPAVPRAAPLAPPAPPVLPAHAREDLLTASRTHFRPIRRDEPEPAPRYVDGDTFDIRADLPQLPETRSASGGVFLGQQRYLEYRVARTIDYGRLRLTEAQRCFELDEPGLRLRFPLQQCDVSAQTEWDNADSGDNGENGSRDWEELVAGISAAHARYEAADALVSAQRKRRHSAARSPPRAPHCPHPHARFLTCCALLDRPLTR